LLLYPKPNPSMTTPFAAAVAASDTVAYKQVTTGHLLLVECEGLLALQLRNYSTAAKTYTIRHMVQKQVERGLLLPVPYESYLQDLQHLQDLQIPRPLQVL